MKFGFIPTEGGTYYQAFLEETLLGEALGFDSVWLEEHHGVKNHYWPSPLVALAGIATRTERLLIGTDIIVLPFYQPVRVAEDVAMLDIMSGGRFILGVAIGYKPDEFALYQAPMEKRGARFEEALQLIKLLWTQDEVTFEGSYYQVQGLKIEPPPANSLTHRCGLAVGERCPYAGRPSWGTPGCPVLPPTWPNSWRPNIFIARPCKLPA
jgi:alkanesulfonate monooxygenase SsuD/methylene tetrahydromethanopterin reductase-like flavin-dependent oxidoreductase (luciferase family)